MQLAQFINKPKTVQSSHQSSSSSVQGFKNILSHGENEEAFGIMSMPSNRVEQLKKELETLDEKLMNTNTINFEEIRASHRNNLETNSSEDEQNQLIQQQQQQEQNDRQQLQLMTEDSNGNIENEDRMFRKSQEYCFKYETQALRDSQGQHIPMNICDQLDDTNLLLNHYKRVPGADISSFINTTNLSGGEGEVSFDYDKILSKRNQNIQNAFENNLNDKLGYIQMLANNIVQIKKEYEVKTLKHTHLKYERDNLVNQIQVEKLKRREILVSCQEQMKRIEIKKKEDERANKFAQTEIKRCVLEHQTLIQNIQNQIKTKEQKIQQLINIMEQESKSSTQENLLNQINGQQQKTDSLRNKKNEVESNVIILKTFLRQIGEEIQMTQEDLSSKLIQRAEFVAQREELDQIYESSRTAFGKDFDMFLKLSEAQSQNSSRYLTGEYEQQKAIIFYYDVLHQLRRFTSEKYHSRIDQAQSKLDNSVRPLDQDKILNMICKLSQELEVPLEPQMLYNKLKISNQEKDILFEKRRQQLSEIYKEVKRYEVLIKNNTNMVDNLTLPQLKAMTATFNEHKNKYKKLKQAYIILKERLAKAVQDLQSLIDQRTKYQQSMNMGTQITQLENELNQLKDALSQESEEKDRLDENASQVEREYRRAQQNICLKERELLHRLGKEGINVSQSQIGSLANSSMYEEDEDDRLKKRLVELEQKLYQTNQERKQASQRYIDGNAKLKEAKDSFLHAQQMLHSAQKGIKSQQDRLQSSSQCNFYTETQQDEYNSQQFGLSSSTSALKQRNQKQSQNSNHSPQYQIFSKDISQEQEQVQQVRQQLSQNKVSNEKPKRNELQRVLKDQNNVINYNGSLRNSQNQNFKQQNSIILSSQKEQNKVQTDKENFATSKKNSHEKVTKRNLSRAMTPSTDKKINFSSLTESQQHTLKVLESLKKQPVDRPHYDVEKFLMENRSPIAGENIAMLNSQGSSYLLQSSGIQKSNSKNATSGTVLSQLADPYHGYETQQINNDSSNFDRSGLNMSDLILNNDTLKNFLQVVSEKQDEKRSSVNNMELLSKKLQQHVRQSQGEAQQISNQGSLLTFNNTGVVQQEIQTLKNSTNSHKSHAQQNQHLYEMSQGLSQNNFLGQNNSSSQQSQTKQHPQVFSSPNERIFVGSQDIRATTSNQSNKIQPNSHAINNEQEFYHEGNSVSHLVLETSINNQSCLVDNSLANCLQEINNVMGKQVPSTHNNQKYLLLQTSSSKLENSNSLILSNQDNKSKIYNEERDPKLIKRSQTSLLKRISIDTADFIPKEETSHNGYQNINKAQTIEVESDAYFGSQKSPLISSSNEQAMKKKFNLKRNIVSQNYDVGVSRTNPFDAESEFIQYNHVNPQQHTLQHQNQSQKQQHQYRHSKQSSSDMDLSQFDSKFNTIEGSQQQYKHMNSIQPTPSNSKQIFSQDNRAHNSIRSGKEHSQQSYQQQVNRNQDQGRSKDRFSGLDITADQSNLNGEETRESQSHSISKWMNNKLQYLSKNQAGGPPNEEPHMQNQSLNHQQQQQQQFHQQSQVRGRVVQKQDFNNPINGGRYTTGTSSSISPKPMTKDNSSRFKQWNRSSSVENRHGTSVINNNTAAQINNMSTISNPSGINYNSLHNQSHNDSLGGMTGGMLSLYQQQQQQQSRQANNRRSNSRGSTNLN